MERYNPHVSTEHWVYAAPIPCDIDVNEVACFLSQFSTEVFNIRIEKKIRNKRRRTHVIQSGGKKTPGYCVLQIAEKRTADVLLGYGCLTWNERKVFFRPYLIGKDLQIFNEKNNQARLFVKNVPLGWTNSDMEAFFSRFGEIRCAYLMSKPFKKITEGGKSLRIGSVQFKLTEPVKHLLSIRNLQVGEEIIELELFLPNPKDRITNNPMKTTHRSEEMLLALPKNFAHKAISKESQTKPPLPTFQSMEAEGKAFGRRRLTGPLLITATHDQTVVKRPNQAIFDNIIGHRITHIDHYIKPTQSAYRRLASYTNISSNHSNRNALFVQSYKLKELVTSSK